MPRRGQKRILRKKTNRWQFQHGLITFSKGIHFRMWFSKCMSIIHVKYTVLMIDCEVHLFGWISCQVTFRFNSALIASSFITLTFYSAIPLMLAIFSIKYYNYLHKPCWNQIVVKINTNSFASKICTKLMYQSYHFHCLMYMIGGSTSYIFF